MSQKNDSAFQSLAQARPRLYRETAQELRRLAQRKPDRAWQLLSLACALDRTALMSNAALGRPDTLDPVPSLPPIDGTTPSGTGPGPIRFRLS